MSGWRRRCMGPGSRLEDLEGLVHRITCCIADGHACYAKHLCCSRHCRFGEQVQARDEGPHCAGRGLRDRHVLFEFDICLDRSEVPAFYLTLGFEPSSTFRDPPLPRQPIALSLAERTVYWLSRPPGY